MGRDEQANEDPPDSEPLTGLTGFERNLLFAITRLDGTNPHGVAIKEELERHYDEEINRGRLYMNLRRLEEDGHVESVPLDGRTNVYRVTDRTRELLAAHREWERECLAAGRGDGDASGGGEGGEDEDGEDERGDDDG